MKISYNWLKRYAKIDLAPDELAKLLTNCGLEVESYHPGTAQLRDHSMTLRDVFQSLFPHLEKLGDFGPMAYTHAPGR